MARSTPRAGCLSSVALAACTIAIVKTLLISPLGLVRGEPPRAMRGSAGGQGSDHRPEGAENVPRLDIEWPRDEDRLVMAFMTGA